MGLHFHRGRPGAIALVTVAVLSTALLALTTGRAAADEQSRHLPELPRPRAAAGGGLHGSRVEARARSGRRNRCAVATCPAADLAGRDLGHERRRSGDRRHQRGGRRGRDAARVDVTIDADPIYSCGQRSVLGEGRRECAGEDRRPGEQRLGPVVHDLDPSTSAIPADGTPADALAQLNADTIVLLQPPDGFTSIDGLSVKLIPPSTSRRSSVSPVSTSTA